MARKLNVRTIRGGSTKRNHHYSATGLSGISGEAESSSDSLKSTRNTGRISPKGDFRPVCFLPSNDLTKLPRSYVQRPLYHWLQKDVSLLSHISEMRAAASPASLIRFHPIHTKGSA